MQRQHPSREEIEEAIADLPPITEEMRAKIREHFRQEAEKQTPSPGNLCKDCGSRVVKKVASLFRGRYGFHTPACECCGRIYRLAENVPEVGVKEFEEMLNRPFTI